MSTLPDPAGSPAPSREADLARLDVQVEAMRAVLVRLLQDVVVAERRLERADSDRVVAVNERLVVAALTSQADAESAARALRDAQSSAALDGSRPVADVAAGAQSPGGGGASDLERRHAMLREANEQLVLAALSAQELKDAAELVRRRQAAFVAAVADELSNPMAPIRIAAAMLGRPAASEPLLPHVQRIVEQQLTHVSRLVGKLVDAGNGSDGALSLDLQRVDMALVIDECIAAHRPAMEARGQHFESHRPAGVLLVRGDVHRLVQVLGNLLDNASNHTRNGGHISLSTVASIDTLTMTVSDNGIGITPQMLPRIFDPFMQDVHAIGFQGIGLGIGLTVVRALLRAHGGDLAARSSGVGRGSQFTMTLPLAGSA